MKDILGKRIEIGQIAIFNPPHYKGLQKGYVDKINRVMVRVKYNEGNEKFHNVYPWDIVVLEREDG